MDPGIYDDVPNETYHASPGISKTGVVTFDRSPAAYRYGERTTTRALALGTLFHTALFEPDELLKRYHPVNIRMDIRTAEHKAATITANGRELIKQSEFDNALRMRDQVMKEPVARELITPEAIIERSAVWIDPATGVTCRCRPDLIQPRMRAILDAKKCTDARPFKARSAVTEYKYHWADAFYSEGMKQADGWTPDAFIFLFIEAEAPFLCRPYEIDPEDVAIARQDIEAILPRYRDCLASDHWPRFPETIERLPRLPKHAHSDWGTNA